MVGERTYAGIEIQDRRASGVNFAQILAESYFDSLSVPTGDPTLFFDPLGSRVLEHSKDRNHVLVMGIDGDKRVLVRDGVPIFASKATNGIGIEARSDDLSRLVVGQSEGRSGVKRLVLVDEQGQVELLEAKNADMVWHSEDFNRFWLSGTITRGPGKKKTVLSRWNVVGQKATMAEYFEVGGEYQHPKLVGIDKDTGKITWLGRAKHKDFVYRGRDLLLKGGYIKAFANEDMSVQLYTVCEDTQTGAEIYYVQGAESKPKLIAMSRGFVDKVQANDSLSRAAVLLYERMGKASLVFIVDGEAHSTSFAKLKDLNVGEDGHIVAQVVDKQDVERVITWPHREYIPPVIPMHVDDSDVPG